MIDGRCSSALLLWVSYHCFRTQHPLWVLAPACSPSDSGYLKCVCFAVSRLLLSGRVLTIVSAAVQWCKQAARVRSEPLQAPRTSKKYTTIARPEILVIPRLRLRSYRIPNPKPPKQKSSWAMRSQLLRLTDDTVVPMVPSCSRSGSRPCNSFQTKSLHGMLRRMLLLPAVGLWRGHRG